MKKPKSSGTSLPTETVKNIVKGEVFQPVKKPKR